MRWFIISMLLLSSCFSIDFSDRPCEIDSDCLDDTICAGRRCVDPANKNERETLLRTPLCDEVYPNDTPVDELTLMGVLLPTNIERGRQRVEASKLAVDEINQVGGVSGQPLGLLVCDSAVDSDQARSAAEYMSSFAGVSAIVGAATSQVTIDAFNGGVRDNNALLMSPSATSPRITNQHPHLWRTAPSDAAQGVVIAKVLREIEANKVAIVHIDDAYGSGLRDVVREAYCIDENAVDQCRLDPEILIVRSFLDEEDTDTQDEIVSELQNFEVDALVVIAQLSSTISFLERVQQTGLADLPIVLGDAANQDEILELNSSIQNNIVGTTPAVAESSDFGRFSSAYEARNGIAPPNFTPHTYDATYLLAYAMGASDTGPASALADVLSHLSDGADAAVGPDGFQTNIATLKSGESIDFQGASGALNFIGTEAQGDVGMWRLQNQTRVDLGIAYDAESNVFSIPAGLFE